MPYNSGQLHQQPGLSAVSWDLRDFTTDSFAATHQWRHRWSTLNNFFEEQGVIMLIETTPIQLLQLNSRKMRKEIQIQQLPLLTSILTQSS